MEWVDGVKLTDKAAMAAAGLDIIDFVDVGIECTLRQLLEHGYFHADPHPGAGGQPLSINLSHLIRLLKHKIMGPMDAGRSLLTAPLRG